MISDSCTSRLAACSREIHGGALKCVATDQILDWVWLVQSICSEGDEDVARHASHVELGELILEAWALPHAGCAWVKHVVCRQPHAFGGRGLRHVVHELLGFRQ